MIYKSIPYFESESLQPAAISWNSVFYTFIDWIEWQVPELKLDLLATTVGKDWRLTLICPPGEPVCSYRSKAC